MPRVVITGGRGFIGRNLRVALDRRKDLEVACFDRNDPAERMWAAVAGADVIYHLAGVNRPKHPDEFRTGNTELTAELCRRLVAAGGSPTVVFASSIQAARENPYGSSKRAAEEAIEAWSVESGGSAVIFRLSNVFGKWGRPGYNSVVATFCHNIAHGLPIRLDDPDASIELVHVVDVVAAFAHVLHTRPRGLARRTAGPVVDTTVGELADRITAYRAAQFSPNLPDLSGHFDRALFSTYLSYLEPTGLAFDLDMHADERGGLAELVRESHAGQIFVSRTRAGVTRGNHYHDTKVERFMVVAGEAVVRLRRVGGSDVHQYGVNGDQPQAVIIPPGMVHSIENVGRDEMITLFWADEVFDPDRPDTYSEPVLPTGGGSS